MHICDGSGLSRYNSFTPKHIVFLLKHMNSHKNKNLFFSSFSVCGKDGTLEEKFCNEVLVNNLIGKTGSMTRVSNLTGIIKTKKGTTLAFALMVNNFNCKSKEIEKAIEEFLVNVYNLF